MLVGAHFAQNCADTDETIWYSTRAVSLHQSESYVELMLWIKAWWEYFTSRTSDCVQVSAAERKKFEYQNEMRKCTALRTNASASAREVLAWGAIHP